MFDLKTWDGFSELKKEDLDYLLDTTALNKKMADRKDNPYRWKIGSFMVPKRASKEQREKASKIACDKFIQVMEKQGWELKSKVQIYGTFPAIDLYTQAVLLDMDEIHIRGIFGTKPKPVRIEIPPEMVRRYPEQKMGLQEVMKVTGIRPVPQKERVSV